MIRKHRDERAKELRSIIEDPVERIVLERVLFEATKSMPPRSDGDLIDAILRHEYDGDAAAEADAWALDPLAASPGVK